MCFLRGLSLGCLVRPAPAPGPVDQLDDPPPLPNSVAKFADMFRLRPMKSAADGQTAGDQEPLASVR